MIKVRGDSADIFSSTVYIQVASQLLLSLFTTVVSSSSSHLSDGTVVSSSHLSDRTGVSSHSSDGTDVSHLTVISALLLYLTLKNKIIHNDF